MMGRMNRFFLITGSLFCMMLGVYPVLADQVKMDVALANPYLVAGDKSTTYLKVGLTGFEMKSQDQRPPVNVALVIDKSGSMNGEKIKQARQAAKLAVERLQPEDIVSIVAYDSGVRVLVPATKLTDKAEVLRQIDTLGAKGSTALFAGVSKGAGEVRKFLADGKVNRVILLSDGQANVGPQSPGELGELGESLVKEGISVSTIGLGLGYNEDLMVKLAMKSDGNHVFVEDPELLAGVFDEEFGDILSVVAQEVDIQIELSEGIRPVRALGREADIAGQKVRMGLNQLYSGQEKFLILEIEVPGGEVNSVRDVADVKVTYANMSTQTQDELASSLDVRFAQDEQVVQEQVNEPVMASSVLLIATENNKRAMYLRDEGKIEEAKQVLQSNGIWLTENSMELNAPQLQQYAEENFAQIGHGGVEGDWSRNRKIMTYQQIQNTGNIRSTELGTKSSIMEGESVGGADIVITTEGNVFVGAEKPGGRVYLKSKDGTLQEATMDQLGNLSNGGSISVGTGRTGSGDAAVTKAETKKAKAKTPAMMGAKAELAKAEDAKKKEEAPADADNAPAVQADQADEKKK